MDLRRISPPITRQQTQSVVTIEEVKAQARVTHDSEDDLIANYIAAAYHHLSGPNGWLNGYCLLPEEYEYSIPSVCADGFNLPLRPLQDVTPAVQIAYRDSAGTYTYLDAGLYFVTSGTGLPRLNPLANTTWPVPSLYGHPHAYRVTILAGHADGSEVPEPIKLGMMLLAAHWYANREATGPAGRNAGASIPYGMENLCGRYRLAHDHS